MSTTAERFLRGAIVLGAATVLGLGTAGPSGAGTPPFKTAGPGPVPDAAPAPGVAPAPGGRGEVHSWALVPGDGGAGSRSRLTYDMAPGSEVQDSVTLLNYSNVALTFEVYATDALNNADGAFDPLPGDQEPKDVGTWVTLPQRSIIVEAAGRATFPFTVRVPVDARPGDHAGAILAASRTRGTGPEGKTVALERRTGSRLYIRVDGPLEPELAVEGLSTSYSPELSPLGGRAEVRYRVVNRGNVRLRGEHRLSVAGPFGLMRRRLSAMDVPELLPGESIEITRSVEDVPAAGLTFTKVDLEAEPAPGDEVEGLEPASRRAVGLAIPVTVAALILVALLTWYARRSYLRRRDQGGGGGGGAVPGDGPDDRDDAAAVPAHLAV